MTTAIGSGNDRAQAVAIQSDGKIVVAGYSSNGSDNDFALVRYNANGSLDINFGASVSCTPPPFPICVPIPGTGKVTTAVGSGNDWAFAITLKPDGKIVAVGNAGGDFALVRYNDADGSLDTSFGASGKVITDIGGGSNSANAVAIQPDGKIVAVGNAAGGAGTGFALVRYNVADGSLDTSFGASGKVITTISGSGGGRNDSAQAVAIQSDGKIVAAGYAYNVDDTDFALARYLP